MVNNNRSMQVKFSFQRGKKDALFEICLKYLENLMLVPLALCLKLYYSNHNQYPWIAPLRFPLIIFNSLSACALPINNMDAPNQKGSQ